MKRIVNVRYSEEDYAKLVALADQAGVTVTEFVRISSLHVTQLSTEKLAHKVDEIGDLLVLIAQHIEDGSGFEQQTRTPSTRGNW